MSCEACRTIPPVVTGEYTPKGQYETLAGLRTYSSNVTGNQASTANIVDIYDIFGLASQTIQGADLLAQRLNAIVLVPDFFQGDALSHDIIPPNTEEKKARMGEFPATKANIPENWKVLWIPHIVLASKDEPADVVKGYAETISTGKGGYVETYSDMWHGWVGARANLKQEESRAEYTRGYNKLGDFFAENLS
ncbi:hypothetical protein N7493_006069 [Penicillium malachiteum]|uniref:Dienelactone hydrolase domain-containing protein n=1 Tax=Penicillium malachiteum TaxID=1324776 RepID=A0AAD6HLW9_9EURO|nr:hypothetical protein N7493_006069 [Penicillium malachiteum]